MAEQIIPRPCKRRQQSTQGQLPSDTLQHPSKKQKLSYPTRPPPTFWDNLSEIPLIRSALRELDRRDTKNTYSAHSWRRQQASHSTRRAANTRSQLSATDFLGRCTQTCVRSIQRSARHGGPDLSDLRGVCRHQTFLVTPANLPLPQYSGSCGVSKHRMSSSQSSLGRRKWGSGSLSKSTNTSNTKTTKSTGLYDCAFQQHLIDFGIYPDEYEYPDGRVPPGPDNIDEISLALARLRPSLSPSRFSDEDFRKFKRANAHAAKERQVTTSVIPIIEGHVEDHKCVAGEIPFTNLDHLTDGSLVSGNPDLYYGARPEQLNRQVRTELSGHITPSTQQDLPVVPTFFLAAKGPDGSLAVAGRQACYDGALGARGIHSLQSYGRGQPAFDNKAYTLTSIYHGGQLKIYTSHPIQPASPGARPGYAMTEVNSLSLTGNAESFRRGARAYRNARDWAKKQRDEVIRHANEAANLKIGASPLHDNPALSSTARDSADDTFGQASQSTLTPVIRDSNAPASFDDSDNSADELSMDSGPLAKRSRGPQKASDRGEVRRLRSQRGGKSEKRS